MRFLDDLSWGLDPSPHHSHAPHHMLTYLLMPLTPYLYVSYVWISARLLAPAHSSHVVLGPFFGGTIGVQSLTLQRRAASGFRLIWVMQLRSSSDSCLSSGLKVEKSYHSKLSRIGGTLYQLCF